jgi:hypothetical protein
MESIRSDSATGSEGGSSFRTTHWSMVLLAGHADPPASGTALETLCRAYWYPLCASPRPKAFPRIRRRNPNERNARNRHSFLDREP